jgi:hypothetical protein
MIELNFKVFENGDVFCTDFILPDGEKIIRNESNPDEAGFEKLVGFEKHKAIMKCSDGRQRIGFIHDISSDELYFTDDE